MSKYRKRTHIIKFFVTLCNLVLFNYVIIYADKFQVKLDNMPVRADFINTTVSDDDMLAVRLDNVIIDDKGHDGNITYVIKPGDTLTSIAQDVGTTVSNIRRVNGLAADVDIRGDATIVDKEGIALHRLTISQLPGIVIAMDATTSVAEFAKQYNLNEDDIKSLNNISDSKALLRAGDELFLTISEKDAIQKGILEDPNAGQPEVQVAVNDPKKPEAKPGKQVAVNTKPAAPKKAKAQIISSNNGIIDYDQGTILSSWFQKDKWYAGFAAWYCTSYAAAKRPDIFGNADRAFRGNAGAWYANAKAAGNKVGTKPQVWAIVVFAPWRWASGYGHVGIVEKVDAANGKIVISDMNYKWRNIVTKRVVDADLGKYIY